MSTRIGYVWKNRKDGNYIGPTGAPVDSVVDADMVDNSTLTYGMVPVRVTEEPGPPIREVVELRGTVDLDGLKFAIRRPGWFWTSHVWQPEVGRALLYDSVSDAARRANPFAFTCCMDSEIVGVREVPGPTVRTVTEITE